MTEIRQVSGRTYQALTETDGSTDMDEKVEVVSKQYDITWEEPYKRGHKRGDELNLISKRRDLDRFVVVDAILYKDDSTVYYAKWIDKEIEHFYRPTVDLDRF